MTPGQLILIAIAAAVLAVPRVGLISLARRLRSFRERAQREDALKHVLEWQQRSKRASLESLAGSLGLSPSKTLRLEKRLEAAGWTESGTSGIGLTPVGERRALQVVRAHRLWERHLADDANMSLDRLHQAAERAEHSLSQRDVSKLDAHLGHPQVDPHGDPIPSEEGVVARLDARSINEWPQGTPARVAHIEDEPHAVFLQILESGLRPAQVVTVVEADASAIVVECEGRNRRIDRAVANNIHVCAARREDVLPAGLMRMSDLGRGISGEVVALGHECTGFTRRRLLDLGLTPGAGVQVALVNTFGDPRAFRIRGTTIALRKQQADQVWIRPNATQPAIDEASR